MNHIPTEDTYEPTDKITTTRRPLLHLKAVTPTYGITERMLRRLVAERRIPFVKVGKHVCFRPEDIEAWLDENTVPAVTGTRTR